MKNLFNLIFILLSILSCLPQKKSQLPIKVDSEQIYKLISKQISFGPRPAGSKNLKKLFYWMKNFTQKFPTMTIKQQKMISFISGKKRVLRNLIVRYHNIKTKNKEFIIIGSHYDTKDKIENFIGANDAGSSTAILLYLIQAINDNPHLASQINCELRFVFFDGEEAYHEYTHNDGLIGSKHYAQELVKNDNIKNCRGVIIADMLGDKQLEIKIPQNTNPQLAQKALNAAANLSLEQYISQGNAQIIDDHLSFHQLNIPTINLIDFEFGHNNHLWHTKNDTLEHISKKNLAISTKILLKTILNLAK